MAHRADSVDGLLVVAKPCGPTSREVVDLVQRQVRPDKVGHAGTLDPLASGVLVLAVGVATRLIPYVQRSSKHYVAEFRLGVHSPTDDLEGEVSTPVPGAHQPPQGEVEQALTRFHGEQWQVPPDYSAVKVRGRRAYKLARRGEQLSLAPRRIVIHALSLLAYEYPVLRISITCGGGTYVRALGRDIAESLGTSAVMTSLVRDAIGPFDLQHATAISALASRHGIRSALLPPRMALTELFSLSLDDDQCRLLWQGRPVAPPAQFPLRTDGSEEVAVLGPDGDLLGVAIADAGWLRPKICLPWPPPDQRPTHGG